MTVLYRRRKCRRGHSLTELVIAMPLVTLLVGGLFSAIYIAGQAIPSSTSVASEALAVQAAMTRMVDDLRHATAITSNSATEIIFQVPDRDSDNLAETIRYSWSGTPGAPILCQFNALAPEQRISGVNQFALRYTTVSSVESMLTVHRLCLVDVQVRKLSSSQDYLASTTVPCRPAVSTAGSADEATVP